MGQGNTEYQEVTEESEEEEMTIKFIAGGGRFRDDAALMLTNPFNERIIFKADRTTDRTDRIEGNLSDEGIQSLIEFLQKTLELQKLYTPLESTIASFPKKVKKK